MKYLARRRLTPPLTGGRWGNRAITWHHVKRIAQCRGPYKQEVVDLFAPPIANPHCLGGGSNAAHSSLSATSRSRCSPFTSNSLIASLIADASSAAST